MSDSVRSQEKMKWETSDLTNPGKTAKKTLNYRGISAKYRKRTHGNSGPTPVARGAAGAKLAARTIAREFGRENVARGRS